MQPDKIAPDAGQKIRAMSSFTLGQGLQSFVKDMERGTVPFDNPAAMVVFHLLLKESAKRLMGGSN